MKILKIFGIVVGIHVFALILIFANPGCSSTSKPAPSPADTAAGASAPQSAPMITVPPAGGESLAGTPVAPAPGMDSTAPAAGDDTSGVRFSPTRPNTPAASAVLRAPVDNVTPASTYTVKSGDSFWSLQKKFHISYKVIAEANNLRTNSPLHPGQKLIIPAPASKATARSTPAVAPAGQAARSAGTSERPTAHEFKYKVKPGETLGGIAHKFGVSVRKLAVQNSISDPMKLRAGTELVIPGWQPAGGAAESRPAARHERATRSAPAPAPAPEAAPAASEPQPTPSAAPDQTPSGQVPNLLAPSPSEPTPTQTSTVPVINIDDGSATSSTSTNQ